MKNYNIVFLFFWYFLSGWRLKIRYLDREILPQVPVFAGLTGKFIKKARPLKENLASEEGDEKINIPTN
jgi:hypothetical protein